MAEAVFIPLKKGHEFVFRLKNMPLCETALLKVVFFMLLLKHHFEQSSAIHLIDV